MAFLLTSNLRIVTNDSQEASFVFGNIFSIIAMSVVYSLRNTTQRSLMFIALMSIKFYVLTEDPFLATKKFGLFLPIPIFLLTFYIYDQIHDRKMFKAAYEAHDRLKTLQKLLFNNAGLNVVIVSKNLENIRYSNYTQEEGFVKIDLLNKIMLDPSSLNTSNSFPEMRSEAIEEEEEIPLMSFLQNNKLSLDNTIQLQGNYNEDNKKTVFQIRLTKTYWDGELAYAIILQEMTSPSVDEIMRTAEDQKEKMIATVSHELRTPINGILGLIEMIASRITDSQALTYLDNCKSCSKLLLYLVNSILNLSQLRNNKLVINKEFVNLDRYLEEIRSLYLFSSQQKGISFIIDKDPKVPQRIYTDQYKLSGVLVNLISNAMKFTFKGSVTLKILSLDNDCVVFSVEDTGIGIQENDKAKLFKTFGTIEQKDKRINSQGVGLGLMIVKGLVEALSEDIQGKIEFESEYNKGSKFWFKLNVAGPALSPLRVSRRQQKSDDTTHILNDTAYFLEQSLDSNRNPEINIKRYTSIKYHNGNNKFGMSAINSACTLISSSSGKKYSEDYKQILVVDDVPLNITAIKFNLEKLGYQVTKAFSAEEALELLGKKKRKPCMVITDIQMPIMNGLQMSKIIREMILNGELYDLPIVGLTAQKLTKKEKEMYKECGIDCALEKPLGMDELKNVLSNFNLPF